MIIEKLFLDNYKKQWLREFISKNIFLNKISGEKILENIFCDDLEREY